MTHARLVLALVLALGSTAPMPAWSQSAHASERRTLHLASGERSYLLRVPDRQEHPAPLLLVFHGGGGRAQGIVRHTGFQDLPDVADLVIVYPEGLGGRWNDGRSYGLPTDDVGFIRVLLDTLERELAIDQRRIFATGISNGAMFTYRLACDLPGVFAAIAPVAGALPTELSEHCAGAWPVSVIAFQGTEDPLMPYAGGGVARRRGWVLAAEQSVAFWAKLAACADQPAVLADPDRVADGTRVRRAAYEGCRPGIAVVLYTIEGGGHTWPGGPAAGRRVGRVSRELDATRVMWDFFQRHSRQ